MKNLTSELMQELGGLFVVNGIYVPFKDSRQQRVLRTKSLDVFGNSFYSEVEDGDMRNYNRLIKGEFLQTEKEEYMKFLKTNKSNSEFDLAYVLKKKKFGPGFNGIEGSYEGVWGKLPETYNLDRASKDFFKNLHEDQIIGPRHAKVSVSRKD